MLGADTRSTAGSVVADKNCEKIHYIAPNIYCCGAGTAADTENVTGTHWHMSYAGCESTLSPGMISSALELHRYATGRQTRVVTAMTLLKSHLFRYTQTPQRVDLRHHRRYRYQGHVSAALVLGGVDVTGPHLFTVRCAQPVGLFSLAPFPLQVYPHGSTDSLPFCTMGSGSLNAMAVFEAGYKCAGVTMSFVVHTDLPLSTPISH